MSGGHWEYRQYLLGEEINTEKLKKIVNAVEDALNVVDWALSGDSSKEGAEKKLFKIFEKLGDDLYI